MIGQTRVSANRVWQAWVKAHAVHGSGKLVSGSCGHMETKGQKKIPYQIIDVVEGTSFSILWKAMFIRLVFSYRVVPLDFGSEISYDFQMKGSLAWMVRWFLAPKIRANLSHVLKTFIRNLEMS
jgi:hypothetical protein